MHCDGLSLSLRFPPELIGDLLRKSVSQWHVTENLSKNRTENHTEIPIEIQLRSNWDHQKPVRLDARKFEDMLNSEQKESEIDTMLNSV